MHLPAPLLSLLNLSFVAQETLLEPQTAISKEMSSARTAQFKWIDHQWIESMLDTINIQMLLMFVQPGKKKKESERETEMNERER